VDKENEGTWFPQPTLTVEEEGAVVDEAHGQQKRRKRKLRRASFRRNWPASGVLDGGGDVESSMIVSGRCGQRAAVKQGKWLCRLGSRITDWSAGNR